MRDSQRGYGGGCGLARCKEPSRRKVPRVVLGGEPGFAAGTADMLRRIGWDVCMASTSDDLYDFAVRKNPLAVMLPVETAGESGYLTCAKLRLTRPKLKVLLIGEPTERARQMAGFVGANLTSEANAVDAVMKLI